MTGATQSRLQVRAIVAARRAEDHRRDIEEALDELRYFKSAYDGLVEIVQHVQRALEQSIEALDKHDEAVEHLLALACVACPPSHRERFTDTAREATKNGSKIAGSLSLLDRALVETVGRDISKEIAPSQGDEP